MDNKTEKKTTKKPQDSEVKKAPKTSSQKDQVAARPTLYQMFLESLSSSEVEAISEDKANARNAFWKWMEKNQDLVLDRLIK